jgi:23S rRNA pseudouridine1911/1915/1917 synthase
MSESSPKRLTLPEGQAPTRLDKVLVELLDLSRARAKKLLEDDAVRVNGRRLKKGLMVKGGDVIEVKEGAEAVVDPNASPEPQPDLPVRVAYEDAHLVVFEKPSGMPSHPLQVGERGTVANFIAARFPECLKVAPEALREAGLVHRLDTETSGLVCAARTAEAHAALRQAFSLRAVEKIYLAAVSGPIGDEGLIELPLAHDPRDKRKMLALGSDDLATQYKARQARTSFKVLERAIDRSVLEVRIDTGVMHQIRAHLAAIGAPILGDALYGGEALPGLKRHFLHATKLGFMHPMLGQRVDVESPLPPDLVKAWADARQAGL